MPSYTTLSALRTPRKPVEVTSVLSARKPEKPTNALYKVQHLNNASGGVPMYPKHRVYAGLKEMSLEELRAADYRERKQKRQMQGVFCEIMIAKTSKCTVCVVNV